MYDKFIEMHRGQYIPKEVYSEVHHIVPRHMGGSDEISNLIRLTYRQHILAHLLLFRKYRKIEDWTAYKLMTSCTGERKSIISKMIGERHKLSGHIYALGAKNRETGHINAIKTKESLRKGGLRGGQIARETGHIYTIRTQESSSLGGKISGAIATSNGQIQKLGKYKGIYVLIMPDGTEFQHAFQAVEYMDVPKEKIIDWCRNNRFGYSRREKTQEELESRWANIE
jgi:hypothetical protein